MKIYKKMQKITLSGDARRKKRVYTVTVSSKNGIIFSYIGRHIMGEVLKSATALPDYRLQLVFLNGSSAVINMEKQVKTFRFACLSSKQVFDTARAEGDRIVWTSGATPFGVYCKELLDAMLTY